MVSTNQSHLFPPNGIPGREWYQGLTKRWSHKLCVRDASNISSLKVPSCTEDETTSCFNTLQKQFLKGNINNNTSCNLWNFDEIEFSSNQGKKHSICKRGAKRPLKLVGKKLIAQSVIVSTLLVPFCDHLQFTNQYHVYRKTSV